MKERLFTLLMTMNLVIPVWGQWSTTTPTSVCTAANTQSNPVTISDGQGGIVMAWSDLRNDNVSPFRNDIYIQRLDANGVAQWTSNGVAVTTGNFNDELYPQLTLCYTSSGQARAMVTWLALEYPDQVSGSNVVSKIYTQAYDLNGVAQYASPTLVGNAGVFNAVYPSVIATADGRRLIVGYLTNGVREVRVQGIEPNDGSTQFGINGTLLANWSYSGIYKQLVVSLAEENNQVNIFWNNFEGVGATNILAQRINVQTGAKVWANNLVICNNIGDQYVGEAVGNTLVWEDTRNRAGNNNDDIFAQRVNANGTVAWAANGIRIYEDPSTGAQRRPRVAATEGGVFVTWNENTSGTTSPARLVVQKVLHDGSFPWGNTGITYQTFTISGTVGTLETSIASQSDGGAVFIYFGSNQGYLKAQRITANGRRLWRENGEPVAGTAYNMFSNEFTNIAPMATGGGLAGFTYNGNIYAAKAGFCLSPPSTPTVATIRRCNPPLPVSVTLNAVSCTGGSVYWYQTANSGIPIQPSSAFTTSVNGDATFFAECVNNTTGCASYTLGLGFVDIVPATISNAQLAPIYNSSNSPNFIQAAQTITATNTIQSTGNIIYQAGQSVLLLPNFIAEKNATFLAEAKGCINEN